MLLLFSVLINIATISIEILLISFYTAGDDDEIKVVVSFRCTDCNT